MLKECWRALEPNGRLGVVCLLQTEKPNKIVRLYEWFHDILPTYLDCRLIEGSRMIQAAGFTVEGAIEEHVGLTDGSGGGAQGLSDWVR